jgi:hypothetical protein
MVRRLFAVLALAVVPFMGISTALGPGAGAASPGPIKGCMNGGWLTFTEASGEPFANQGQCIAYAIHHLVSLADLASSSFNATSYAAFGCSFVGATFGATYPASSAVGPVTLQTEGCIPFGGGNFPFTFLYSGTFTITTSVGTLSGTAAGQITNVILPPPPYEVNLEPVTASLALTAKSGTGLFTGTTGTLNLGLTWTEPGTPPIVGSITPA